MSQKNNFQVNKGLDVNGITVIDSNANGTFNTITANTLSVSGVGVTYISTTSNAAFTQANSATTLAQAAFDSGNTTNAYAVSGYGQANTATTLVQAAFNAGNTTNTYATSGYGKANSANVLAQSAYTQANTGTTLAQSAYSQANTGTTLAQSAFNSSNTVSSLNASINTTQNTNISAADTKAQTAFDSGNTTNTYAVSGYAKANSANVLAQSAYTQANTDVTSISTTAGVYGGSTAIPVITLSANGRVSGITNTSITTGTTITNETSSASTYYPMFTSVTSGSISAANTSFPTLTWTPYTQTLETGQLKARSVVTVGGSFPAGAGTIYVANSSGSNIITMDGSTGTVTAVDINTTSDAQYKENIQTISSPFNIINSINGVSFNWKDTGNKTYGVIAQELQQVLPELVKQGDQGLTVSYLPLIAILIEAVKEQQKQIDELKK